MIRLVRVILVKSLRVEMMIQVFIKFNLDELVAVKVIDLKMLKC